MTGSFCYILSVFSTFTDSDDAHTKYAGDMAPFVLIFAGLLNVFDQKNTKLKVYASTLP
jgi:hypothetical protein